MKITKEIIASDDELESLEMHSVINILSVITSQLQMIQMESNYTDQLDPVISTVMELAEAAYLKDKLIFNRKNVSELEQQISDVLLDHKAKQAILNDGKSIEEYSAIFKQIFEVFEVRFNEIIQRWDNPNQWVPFKVKSFEEDFKKFFFALEKNSKGRYKILYNIADQDEKDYLVNFAIDSEDEKIYMPLILKDVIRDLIANARKYTPPGGDITIGISQKKGVFKFVVEDTGFGIPSDEIEKVVDYGYRASNVKDVVRTMGGGFGLTKAYQVVKDLNGHMWINSQVNNGTKISIEVPIPDNVDGS